MATSTAAPPKSPARVRLERLAARREELVTLRAQRDEDLAAAQEHVRETKILADRARVRSLVEPSGDSQDDSERAAKALEAALVKRDEMDQEVADLAMAIRDVEAELIQLRRSVYTDEENAWKVRAAEELKTEVGAVVEWIVKAVALGLLDGSYQGNLGLLVEAKLSDAGWNNERLGRAGAVFIDTKVKVGRV